MASSFDIDKLKEFVGSHEILDCDSGAILEKMKELIPNFVKARDGSHLCLTIARESSNPDIPQLISEYLISNSNANSNRKLKVMLGLELEPGYGSFDGGNSMLSHNKLLAVACSHGNSDAVDILMGLGADIESGDNLPLKIAVKRGYCTLARTLIKTYGADVNASGGLPLCISFLQNFEMTSAMLIQCGANINAHNDLPLFATTHGPCIKMLINAGLNLDTHGSYIIKKSTELGSGSLFKKCLKMKLDFSILSPDDVFVISKKFSLKTITRAAELGVDFKLVEESPKLKSIGTSDVIMKVEFLTGFGVDPTMLIRMFL